jgi:hypothetical protein
MRLTLVVLCLFSTSARADVVNLGALSFDTFIPSAGGFVGVNAFNISNLTGAFSLPPDFPVLDNLTFQSATLKLSNGQAFTLGDMAAGFLLDSNGNPVVHVPADQTYQSAEFTATLSATQFLLSDGTLFQAGSHSIDIFLFPSAGQNLTVDADNTIIGIPRQLVATPEPASWRSVLVFLAWTAWKRRFSRSIARGPL